MALPKRRHSKARVRTRRNSVRTKTPNLVECPQCHEPRLPHRACPNCGTYKGRQVITIKAE
ncbi:MAG: 50S ribosomal protein L32 [Limnochordia bacterium]|nr:50S ribosomal protein L32 [Limnochordia bacterium]MDD2629160.1 50S ribosomal protein L32 [Limnochordia bacterium]MDD4518031.1 50S ribosomal protein L32 [Limnochordia bacterium]